MKTYWRSVDLERHALFDIGSGRCWEREYVFVSVQYGSRFYELYREFLFTCSDNSFPSQQKTQTQNVVRQ